MIVLVVTLLAHGHPVSAIMAAFDLKVETVRTRSMVKRLRFSIPVS